MSSLIMGCYGFAMTVQICRRKKGTATSAEPRFRRIYCGDIFATIVIANIVVTTHVVVNKVFASNYLQRCCSDYISSQKLF